MPMRTMMNFGGIARFARPNFDRYPTPRCYQAKTGSHFIDPAHKNASSASHESATHAQERVRKSGVIGLASAQEALLFRSEKTAPANPLTESILQVEKKGGGILRILPIDIAAITTRTVGACAPDRRFGSTDAKMRTNIVPFRMSPFLPRCG